MLAMAGLAPAALADPILVSRAVGETGTANDGSTSLAWDAVGRFALLHSRATNLVAGQNTPPGNTRLFLWDAWTGEMQLVGHDVGLPTTSTNSTGDRPGQISADGNWVVFASAGQNLVSGQVDVNPAADVFLWHRATDTTILVSHVAGSPVTTGNGESRLTLDDTFADPVRLPRISADGRYITYVSLASDLVAPSSSGGFHNVYVFDRTSGVNRLVSHLPSSATTPGAGDSRTGTISADGRWIAFESTASDLVALTTDTNRGNDVFLWDRDASPASAARLVSHTDVSGLVAGNGPSNGAIVTDDGSAVVFTSLASNLRGVTSDTNAASDVFRLERSTGTLSLVSHRAAFLHQSGNAAAGARVAVNGDGSVIAFTSEATNHVPNQIDTNGARDIFVWSNPALRLVSHSVGSPTTSANGSSTLPWLDLVGGRLTFHSEATDLIDDQVDPSVFTFDVFSWERDRDESTLLSHRQDDPLATGNEDSFLTGLSRGGRVASIVSLASDLVPEDGNTNSDAFLHRLGLLFLDGFETGDTGSWSAVVP